MLALLLRPAYQRGSSEKGEGKGDMIRVDEEHGAFRMKLSK
jgi:hypothetical protein